jgi:hypothetical protein
LGKMKAEKMRLARIVDMGRMKKGTWGDLRAV